MPRGKGTLGAARSRKNEVRPDYLLFWIRQEFAVQASDRRGKGYTPAFSRHGGKRCERPWAHGAEERVEQVRKVPGSGFRAVSIRSISRTHSQETEDAPVRVNRGVLGAAQCSLGSCRAQKGEKSCARSCRKVAPKLCANRAFRTRRCALLFTDNREKFCALLMRKVCSRWSRNS